MLLSDILSLKVMQWQISITHNQCVDVFKSLVFTSQKQEAANFQHFVQTFVHFWFGLSFPVNLHFLCNKTAYLLPTVCVFLRVSTCWMRTGWFKKNKKENVSLSSKRTPPFLPPSLPPSSGPCKCLPGKRENRENLLRERRRGGGDATDGERGGVTAERGEGGGRGGWQKERERHKLFIWFLSSLLESQCVFSLFRCHQVAQEVFVIWEQLIPRTDRLWWLCAWENAGRFWSIRNTLLCF